MTRLSRVRMAGALGALFLGAAALAACTDTLVRLPLDSRVVLGLSEDACGIHLGARTEREYGCLGYRIVTVSRRLPGSIRIDFLGVRPPGGVCATALGPAVASLPLGALPEGQHRLDLAANGVAVCARLRVDPDSLRVEGGEGPWTTWEERAAPRWKG